MDSKELKWNGLLICDDFPPYHCIFSFGFHAVTCLNIQLRKHGFPHKQNVFIWCYVETSKSPGFSFSFLIQGIWKKLQHTMNLAGTKGLVHLETIRGEALSVRSWQELGEDTRVFRDHSGGRSSLWWEVSPAGPGIWQWHNLEARPQVEQEVTSSHFLVMRTK